MTWSKKLDSRAYDPIGDAILASLGAGVVVAQGINSASYTVLNNYYCHFNCEIAFQIGTAPTGAFSLTPPLAPGADLSVCSGHGLIYDEVNLIHRPVFVERWSASLLYVQTYEIDVGAGLVLLPIVGGANSHKLRIQGTYPIR